MRLFSVVVVAGGLILGCAGAKKDGGGGLLGDGVSQDEACTAYLDCLAAVDPNTLASVQSTYGTDGSCWADADAAATCATACETGLEQMHDAYPGEDMCDDGSPLEPSDLEGSWSFETVDSDGGCEEFGISVHEGSYAITADGDDGFTMDGSTSVDATGDSFNFDVTFDCTLSGDAFECIEYAGEYDTYWNLSGDASAALLSGTLAISFGDGTGSPMCTETAEIEGTR